MSKVYTKDQVLVAIDGSAGIVSALAARLGCAWETASRLVNRWEETRTAWKAEREKILDLAESAIVKSIQAGDTQDAKWILSRLGKHRGYGEALQISGENGGEIKIKLTWGDE